MKAINGEEDDRREIEDSRALWFFLLCLTDPRVAHEQGPFDHPSLTVINGYAEGPGGTLGEELAIEIKQVGQAGNTVVPKSFPQFD